MKKVKVRLFGKIFFLKVEYDLFPGEQPLKTQQETLQQIEENMNYFQCSSELLEQYILKSAPSSFQGDAFHPLEYIKPESLYLIYSKETECSAILCEYRLDPEHGLAFEFEQQKLVKIGPQDIVL